MLHQLLLLPLDAGHSHLHASWSGCSHQKQHHSHGTAANPQQVGPWGGGGGWSKMLEVPQSLLGGESGAAGFKPHPTEGYLVQRTLRAPQSFPVAKDTCPALHVCVGASS